MIESEGNIKDNSDGNLEDRTYKEYSNDPYDNGFRGLSMLLEGKAATWWQGIKPTVSNWTEAVEAFKDAYSQKLHLREIFSHEQESNDRHFYLSNACSYHAATINFEERSSDRYDMWAVI
ncbi:hypothetical protein JTB14_000441 [Gonioctena quinquepunctata]|nr:hypothetical protein JTB14_000441 [Gonioctena quinquepunctata]